MHRAKSRLSHILFIASSTNSIPKSVYLANKYLKLYHRDGEALHNVATHNTSPVFAEALRRSPYRPDPTKTGITSAITD